MNQYFLLRKDKKLYFGLPKSWQVLTHVVPESGRVEKRISQMVSDSIAHPIGTLPLGQLMKAADRVVIIVDDFARPTPKREILSCLIDHLEKFGIKDNRVDILFGTGTHRPLSEHEVELAMGKELLRRIRYTIHDCRSTKLVSIGRLKTGGEIKVNSLINEADFRIAIGSVLPHPLNGFGGGGKAILPGVCGYETIRNHHISYSFAQGAFIGNTKKNPFYEEICDAARLAKLDFIINAVYNFRGEVKEIVSGHFKEAQQFGIDLSSKEYSVNIDQDADVSIVSAFPLDDEGPQVLKALGMATIATKKGGTVILVAGVRGGFPEAFLQIFDTAYQLSKGDSKRLVLEYLREGKFIIENAPIDFNAALDYTLLHLNLVNVMIVSKDVSPDEAARLGFRHAHSLDQAIKTVHEKAPQATVHIFPAGGLTNLVLKKGYSGVLNLLDSPPDHTTEQPGIS
jgi:nickel-dependent lactate racemase